MHFLSDIKSFTDTATSFKQALHEQKQTKEEVNKRRSRRNEKLADDKSYIHIFEIFNAQKNLASVTKHHKSEQDIL